MKTFFTIIILFFFICGQAYTQEKEVLKDYTPSKETLSALMLTCYVCHNPRIKSSDDIIAPSLVEVKYIYKTKYPEKTAFVKGVTDFVMDPKREKALVANAVEKFGPMPEMPMERSLVEEIAGYIYSNQVEVPTWFPEKFESQYGKKWMGQ